MPSAVGTAPNAPQYMPLNSGWQLLAEGDGGSYARDGSVAVARGERRCSAPPVRHLAHTLGVNRKFARLAVDARRTGGQLLQWRNETESTRRFVHDGRTWFIRPDGSGVLELDGGAWPFLLEYDRGTLDGGDFRGKFEGYRRYFAMAEWERDFDTEPALLFVCADDRAATRVSRALRARDLDLPVLLTNESPRQSDGRSPAGLMGSVWKKPGPAPTHTTLVEAWRASHRLAQRLCREHEAPESEGETCER